MDRRRFLKLGASGAVGGALAPWLSACAQMDRMIVGDGADETHSVLIIGAGISGLVAARELKKLGVPFRIFEGSERLGGRAYTLEDFNVASQRAEMGAEWISESDSFTLNLCKELHLQTSALPPSSRIPNFLNAERWVDTKALLKDLHQVDRRLLERRARFSDAQWDSISVEDILTELKSSIGGTPLLWMRRLVQLEWGCDPADLSALAYMDRFGSNPSGWKRIQERRIKISGGTQNLATALYDKIAGVVPGRFVLLGHKMKAIQSRNDGLAIDFETKDGVFSINAKVVICTIPFSVLREVKGIENLEFSENKLNAIQNLNYGTHGKIAASFEEKFWPSKIHQWTGNLRSQWIWDSSFEGPLTFASRGVLSAQLGGREGRELGLHSVQDLREDLKALKGKSVAVPTEEQVQLMNWSQNKWSLGSVAALKPNQVHAFSSSLMNSERRGSFIFAGEHTSLSSMGTLNGAIESGLRAAMEAARFKTELSKLVL